MSHEADKVLFDIIRQWEVGKALELSFGAEHCHGALAPDQSAAGARGTYVAHLTAFRQREPRSRAGLDGGGAEALCFLPAMPNFTRSETEVGFDLHFTEEPVREAVRAKARELLAILMTPPVTLHGNKPRTGRSALMRLSPTTLTTSCRWPRLRLQRFRACWQNAMFATRSTFSNGTAASMRLPKAFSKT